MNFYIRIGLENWRIKSGREVNLMRKALEVVYGMDLTRDARGIKNPYTT